MAPENSILPLFVPFAGCPHRCVYCDQQSITGRYAAGDFSGFGRTISSMLDSGKGWKGRPPEVAFYGGTFTAMPGKVQDGILKQAAPFLEAGLIRGIRLSTRPDAVDGEVLDFLALRGVRTIELGAQSMDDRVLELSGRGHTAEDTRRAAVTIREHGFALGLQMMTGLPGDSPGTALRTAMDLADLEPSTIRIYPALVFESTPLAEMWRDGEYRPWSLEETLEILALILPLFRSRGIRVIRIGLHLDRDLLKSGRVLDGPVHPSLGSEAREAVVRRRVSQMLEESQRASGALRVNPGELPHYLGKGRKTLDHLRRSSGNPGLGVVVDDGVAPGWFGHRPPGDEMSFPVEVEQGSRKSKKSRFRNGFPSEIS